MMEFVAEFYKIMFPLLALSLLPVFIAVVCFAIDTYIDFRYYQWNKEKRDNDNATSD